VRRDRKAGVVTSSASELTVVNPTVNTYGKADGDTDDISPRLDSLSGKTIGLLWNAKPFGDVALQTVREQLELTYDDVEFRFYSGNQPHPQKLLDQAFSECDAFIACTAD
jgi:hypothetical protein